MGAPPVEIRGFQAGDLAFIKNAWLKSFRHSPLTCWVPNDIYFGVFSPLLDELIATCEVVVACDPSDPSHIYAFAVLGKQRFQVLHYCYCKYTFRQLGITSQLLKDVGFDTSKPFFYTFLTKAGSMLRGKYDSGVYNPFLLLKPSVEA